MNTLFSYTNRTISTRFIAVVTLVSLVLSAWPASFFAANIAHAGDVLFEDDFESGFTGWAIVGDWEIDESGDAANGTDYAFTAATSTIESILRTGSLPTGYENISLSFSYRLTALEPGEEVRVRYNTIGDVSYQTTFTLGDGSGDDTGDTWTDQIVPLPDDVKQVQFETTFTTNNELFDLDSVTIVGDSIVTEETAEHKIDICHWSEGEQEFELINVAKSSIGNAHGSAGSNDGDIIPAFDDYGGQNMGGDYDGWTGAEVLENDCIVPDPEPDATSDLRVCKLLVDENLEAITGTHLDTTFSVQVQGPEGFDETVEFNTALDLNTKLLNDTAADPDAECVLFEDVATGKYTYEEEVITGDGEWLTPLYHDFFTKVPTSQADFGEYTIDGSDDDNDDTDGVINLGKNQTRTLAIWNREVVQEPEPDDYITVHTTKIVCEDEADLPNYGTGGPNMTEATAIDWISEEHPSCEIVDGWEFEWAPQSADNPDDELADNPYYGAAGGEWTAFTGSTMVPVSAVDGKSFWMREVLQEDYIPFTFGPGNKTNEDNYSAEFYCHTDVKNYDNYDRVDNPKAGEDYYCVAWNVPAEPEQCELDIYSDTMTLVKDTNELAVATYDGNPNWTANIPGATWIWATDEVKNPESQETYTFVETFEVENPTEASITIAYDNWLKFYVNGTLIDDRTGTNGYQDFQKQTYDILSELNPNAENRIELEITNEALDKSNYRNNPAGVLFHLSAIGDEGSCERTTEPESLPMCSTFFTEGIVVTQEDVLLSHDEGGAFIGPEPVDVPAGYYDINAVSFDFHSIKTWDTLELEQWFINGLLSDSIVYTSGVTPDLPDNQNELIAQIGTNVYLEEGLDAIEWVHDAYPNDAYHSIHPLCVQFLPVDDTEDKYLIDGHKYEGQYVREEIDIFRDTTPVLAPVINGTPGLSDWTIELYDDEGTKITSTTTDEKGYYYFWVPEGEYEVREVLKPGWMQVGVDGSGEEYVNTGEQPESCSFELPYDYGDEPQPNSIALLYEGELVKESDYRCDFYNVRTQEPLVRIYGYKFEWLGDQVVPQGLGGWTINLEDAEGDVIDTTVTESDGSYEFFVPAGEYYEVHEVVKSGWSQYSVFEGETQKFPSAQGIASCDFETEAPDLAYLGEGQQSQAFALSEQGGYRCEFYNEQNQIITTTRSSGGSSGTRTREPEPEVAGATTMCPFLEDHMQMAWENDEFEVMKLKMFLNIIMEENLNVDGVFDQATDEAVKRFQARYQSEILTPWFELGIVPHDRPTGFVYKTTRWKINDIVCPDWEPYPSFEGEDLTVNVDLD